MKLYAFNFFNFVPIFCSLYLNNTLLSLIIKDIFSPPLSKSFMKPLIWGKIIHDGLMIIIFIVNKYLILVSLCLNFSDTNIWSTSTNSNPLSDYTIQKTNVLACIFFHVSVSILSIFSFCFFFFFWQTFIRVFCFFF